MAQGVVSAVTAPIQMALHPIQTAQAISNVISDPIGAAARMGAALEATGKTIMGPSTPAGDFARGNAIGNIAGNIVGALLTAGAAAEARGGQAIGEGATVSAKGGSTLVVSGEGSSGTQITANASSLGNPFKDATLRDVATSFKSHVDAGKLAKVGPNAAIGKGAYINTKSGYSYHLDKGGIYRKGVEGPHIDVNYPKPTNVSPKKKLQLAGE